MWHGNFPCVKHCNKSSSWTLCIAQINKQTKFIYDSLWAVNKAHTFNLEHLTTRVKCSSFPFSLGLSFCNLFESHTSNCEMREGKKRGDKRSSSSCGLCVLCMPECYGCRYWCALLFAPVHATLSLFVEIWITLKLFFPTHSLAHSFPLFSFTGPVGKQVKGGYLLRYKRKFCHIEYCAWKKKKKKLVTKHKNEKRNEKRAHHCFRVCCFAHSHYATKTNEKNELSN